MISYDGRMTVVYLFNQQDQPEVLPARSAAALSLHACRGLAELEVAPFRPRRCLPAAVAAGAPGLVAIAAALFPLGGLPESHGQLH